MLIQCRASSQRVVAMSSPSRGCDWPCCSAGRRLFARPFGADPLPFSKLSLSIAKFESSCQATQQSLTGTHVESGVPSSLALRDTFDGVGAGRKTGCEAEEAIR